MKALNHSFRLIGLCFAITVTTLRCVAVDTNGVYFLFVEWVPFVNDSFVVKLTDPAHVQYARDLMRPGSTAERKNAMVRIAAGADGINRDYLTPGAPQWSWHAAEFWGFFDGALPEDFANPITIEPDVAAWIASHNGRAAFDYKPVLELLPPPRVSLSIKLKGKAPELTWSDLGLHYVYTVEVAGSPTGGWSLAPGSSWPVTATNWLDTTLPAAGTRYYRVKAQLKSP